MTMCKHIKIWLFIYTLHFVSGSRMHYITSSSSSLCPKEDSCLTLSTFATKTSDLLDSNTTLIILAGNHTLDANIGMYSVEILRLSGKSIASTTIVCSGNAGFKFIHITHLQINGLEFIRCAIRVEFVEKFTLIDSSLYGNYYSSALHLSQTTSNVTRSSFTTNSAGTYTNLREMFALLQDMYSHRTLYTSYYFPGITYDPVRTGGAIFVTNSSLNIRNSHFENNFAQVGGGIYSTTESKVVISNSTFVNNNANPNCYEFEYSNIHCLGGVIFIDNGCTVIANNNTFINNTSGLGGVIALFYGRFFDNNNLFANNKATAIGGAVFAIGGSRIIMNNSHYRENTVWISGGVVFSINSIIIINNSTFDSNEANDTDGGVLYAQSSSSVNVDQSSFDNNKAYFNGGVMRAVNSTITINNTSFNNNVVQTQGGVIYASDNSIINVNNSSFEYNTAILDGGVLYDIYYSSITVDYSYFGNNKAGYNGGVIVANFTSNIAVKNSYFNNNKARKDGGVAYYMYGTRITVTNSYFEYNEAGENGGVMSAVDTCNVTMNNSSLYKNKAGNNGGALYEVNNGNITVDNSSFHNNRASKYGGALYITDSSRIIVDRTTFENNKAIDGAAIGILEDDTGIIVNRSLFAKNEAAHDGGVIHIYISHNISLSNSSFDNNKAGNDGGVILAYQSIVDISKCFFTTNIALNDGGVVHTYQTNLSISQETIFSYNYAHNDGGVIHAYETTTLIKSTSYDKNKAQNNGGVWFMYQGCFKLTESTMSENEALHGGVMYAYEGKITMNHAIYDKNKGIGKGGALYTLHGNVSISYTSFCKNSASKYGGAWIMDESNATLNGVYLNSNTASSGGAVFSSDSIITLNDTNFGQNTAKEEGGAWLTSGSLVKLYGVGFYTNTATSGGALHSINNNISQKSVILKHNLAHDLGAIHLVDTHFSSYDSFILQGNRGNTGLVYILRSKANFHGDTEFSDNSGSFMMLYSEVVFTENITFFNGSQPTRPHGLQANQVYAAYENIININEVQEGGAITAIESRVILGGTATLIKNYAENGGAIHAIKSKVYINGEIGVTKNMASNSGGGFYLDRSELHCLDDSSLKFLNNIANKNGGGLHAISSSINIDVKNSSSLLNFVKNKAEKGGGLCLESNSALHILKFKPHKEPFSVVNFIANMANKGGAVFVSDESNLGICNPAFSSHYKARECFFQVLAIYRDTLLNFNHASTNIKNIFFGDNHATVSGPSLYGGLIDRCKIHHITELKVIRQNDSQDELVNGLGYIKYTSNINETDISSDPVKLCFCRNGRKDCNYLPDSIQVIKGKKFQIEVVATDQIQNALKATVTSYLATTGGGLGDGQATQNVSSSCTKLDFNLFSPNDKEELIMSAKGPCEHSPMSQRRLIIHFTACDGCPIGFEKHVEETTVCECICDQKLRPYIVKCNASTETLIREGSFWIDYTNGSNDNTSGYLIYPHCPFNYCKPPTSIIEINLNNPKGADTQCTYGHSGILCGSCQSNLSLSLGSTRCILCITNWPTLVAILIAAFLAGIALVAILLIFNLTVAVGTLNGIIFYVNIISTNSSSFLPFTKPNFATIFISWLNLEIGFDACFFPGMDAFWKTLLQLAFPMYVIFLVIMVIFISEHSTKFARFIAKRNPVATLATLILLSYTKFLNTIIASLSHATLVYPDGSLRRVWLPDGTVDYLKGKHIALFVIAILILLAGGVYTVLLFSWQWLLKYQTKIIFSWVKYQKLCHFMEPYHAPYTFTHRYWTGLLLLVRVILCTISAININGNPQVNLTCTIFLVACLLVVKSALGTYIYKNKPLDIMETILYCNIIGFAAFILETSNIQMAVAYTSVLITLALLLAVIVLHFIQYTVIYTALKQVNALASKLIMQHHRMHTRPTRFEDNTPLITHSVVELPSPHKAEEMELATTAADIDDKEEHKQNTNPNKVLCDNECNTIESSQMIVGPAMSDHNPPQQ